MYKNSVMNIRSIDRNVVNCEVWVFVMKKAKMVFMNNLLP